MITADTTRARHVPLSNEEYHAEQEHDSNSWLRIFDNSPAEYYERRVTGRIQPEPATEPQRLGTAIHSCLLEPDKAAEFIICIPEDVLSKSGSRAGAAWTEWLATVDGKLPIKRDEYNQLMWQLESVWSNTAAAEAIRSATALEHSILWTSDEGYRLRVRLDAANGLDAIVTDIKRSRKREANFWQAVREYKYHRQAALYCDGFEALYGIRPTFQFLIINDEPPFDCCVRTLPAAAIQLGRDENARVLAKLYACKRGDAPWQADGFDEVRELEIPPFFYPVQDSYPEV